MDFYTVVCDSRDRPAWLAARRSGVGASEAACIVGEDPRRSMAMLYAEKISEETQEERDDEWLEWGLRHEHAILRAYSSGRYANRSSFACGELLRSTAHPWALATLDAWTTRDDREIPLELKTCEIYHADRWSEGIPREYWWQLQHQMLVTGTPAAAIACLLGAHKMVWCDVERDEQAIARLITAGERFWGYVEQRQVPPGPLDARSLAAVYPRSMARTIELVGRPPILAEGSWMELDDARELTRLAIAEQKRLLDGIDNCIRAAIGANERAVLPNGVTYTLKTDSRGVRPLKRYAPKE